MSDYFKLTFNKVTRSTTFGKSQTLKENDEYSIWKSTTMLAMYCLGVKIKHGLRTIKKHEVKVSVRMSLFVPSITRKCCKPSSMTSSASKNLFLYSLLHTSLFTISLLNQTHPRVAI